MPDNLTLIPLPSYSPELNAMENGWDYLRQNKLAGRLWRDYDSILEACRTAWRFLAEDSERMRSIATRPCACVNL